jgi:crotonobetainyl-CoA:carnitine CoA-transferase CaiB-like acyl-CoA transferase
VTETAHALLATFHEALELPITSRPVLLSEGGSLPSVFAVSDLAQASIAAAGVALAELVSLHGGGSNPQVSVNRDLASTWFLGSLRPRGWKLPPAWDALSGDYLCGDGWIKLHANAPHHRAAILDVLEVPGEREAVATAVNSRSANDLETAVIAAGGAAAAMRSLAEWRDHPQGRAVAAEPLVAIRRTTGVADRNWVGRAERPLAGIRVLDLTRVLAGPVATRMLGGWGADVLRIDPIDWDEPAVAPEVTLGKHCARLDLRLPEGVSRFLELLASADVLVHGYRPDALGRLGLGNDVRDAVNPGLVDVSLDAYGWTGPWKGRRGFDSLVQMSSGIADAGRLAAGGERPVPLPAQALDHATGYLMAASAITGLALRQRDGVASLWRLSLARMAQLLITTKLEGEPNTSTDRPVDRAEGVGSLERTSWGDALRVAPPLNVAGVPLRWTVPARRLGSDEASWSRESGN